jgi:hypothetical protein
MVTSILGDMASMFDDVVIVISILDDMVSILGDIVNKFDDVVIQMLNWQCWREIY